MKTDRHANFASKIGATLAAAGSAVGLGNVWRFPTETGSNGGAAFILIYIFFMLFMAMPIMIAEFTIGRHGQKNVIYAFSCMQPKRKAWRYMGIMPIVAGILILSYYAVLRVGLWITPFKRELMVFQERLLQIFPMISLCFPPTPYGR